MTRIILKPTTEININDSVICDTSYLSLVKVSGEDATTFLQGQFSNDIDLLTENNSQLNSYNSPKGRMYASFRLYKSGDDFFMLLPKEILDPIVKRLRMFVMRSKVVFDDLSAEYKSIGLSSPTLNTDINHYPEEVDGTQHTKKMTYLRIDQRVLVVGLNAEIDTLKNGLNDKFVQTGGDHWKRLDIHAGLPNIYSSTQETFVAQMVNLPLVNGVSFTKGCYPGQEVVARMHYLGKLKKRMYRILIEGQTIPTPGDNLYFGDNDKGQSIGQIVDAQLNDNAGIDALAVIQVSAVEKGNIRLGESNGPAIHVEKLPYSFE